MPTHVSLVCFWFLPQGLELSNSLPVEVATFPPYWEQDFCQFFVLATVLIPFVWKNQLFSHWAMWIPYPFITYIFLQLGFPVCLQNSLR